MKEIELRNVKGCVDYSPREQYIRNYISDTLKKVFEKYGFKPLQTPLLCYYDLLALKYDEENDILKEVYKVTDQGNRNLALRYDLTVPFAKYIAMNPNTKMPFKRYEIGEVFRNGPVKLGRDREFIQCDVDSVGIEGQLTEAEFVALYVEAYNKLNIDYSDYFDVKILEKSSTNRIIKLSINGKEFLGRDLYNILGLKSTDFSLKKDGDKVIINTIGYGHGVGMSQYGAEGMAEEGYSYIDILKHYYVGTNIKKIEN